VDGNPLDRNPLDRIAGLLLTGGASSRMGVDKAVLRVDGRRLAERAAAVLGAVCDPVLEVGPGVSGLDAVREAEPGTGPLAALAAGASALRERGHDGALLVLAVDLPFVDAPLLRLLAGFEPTGTTVVPVADGVPQSLCARYSSEAGRTAAGLVGAGRRSLRALLDEIPWEALPEEEWRAVGGLHALDDVDTPADAERFGLEWPG
jgi:molybdopterin-guanine dinucleotide biosynthesis protein A